MVTYKTLCARHPESDSLLFKKYQSLYEGGKLFRSNIREFLVKNLQDTQQIYEMRCREASYRSYVGPIVDFFAAQLFSAPYAIRTNTETLDDFYPEFKEDVDLSGTDLTSFLKSKFTEALVKGCSYWMVEFPSDEGLAPQDLEEYSSRNLGRAKLCAIPSECILDWECDDNGDYLWVVLHWKSCKRLSPEYDRSTFVETWKILYPDHVDVYEIQYFNNQPPKPDSNITRIASYAHGFNRVPLIKLSLPPGLWLLNRAADAQIEHFRISAALGWSERRSAYAVGVFTLTNKDCMPVVGPGNGIILGPNESFTFAEPNGNSFQILQNEVVSQKNEIYRITNQMAASVDNTSGALGRSADSKSLDMAATEIILHAYSDVVKEAVEDTFELISDGRNQEDLHFSIEGMNKFYLTDAKELVETTTLAKQLQISSPTLYQELDYRVAEALLPWDTSQEVKDTIRQEIFSNTVVSKPTSEEPESVPQEQDSESEDEPNSASNAEVEQEK